MISAHTTIEIHVDYDANNGVSTDITTASDTAVEVMQNLHLKEVIEKKLRTALSPEQLKLVRVVVRKNY